MPHLGLFQLRTRGERPFRLLHHKTQSDGLIMGEIEWLEEGIGEVVSETLALCRRVLEQVVDKLGPSHFLAPLAYADPRWVSYRLAESLPLEEAEKQQLLALRNDGERLERLHARLRHAVSSSSTGEPL
jgi:Lon protease-like protein